MTRALRRSTIMGAAMLAVAATVLLLIAVPVSHASEPVMPAGSGIGSWYENGAHGHYVVEMIEGRLPASAAQGLHGRVMTDANCAPDAQGLNHCHNQIVLDDGTRLTVVNHHQMSRHHCLRPGESIRISPLAGRWASLQTLD